jgi:hypothetical protein
LPITLLPERRVILGKKRAEPQEQPAIWEIPDEVWPLIQTILDEHYYYNVTSSQAIQALEDAPAMGQIRGMVLLLDILDSLQRLLGCQGFLG